MQIHYSQTNHDWKKSNLVTKMDKKGGYDEYTCTKCNITAKRYGLGETLTVTGVPEKKVLNCGCIVPKRPFFIKVRKCVAVGSAFENLTPNSIHQTVNPPEPYKDDSSGVWVNGVGEKVKLLNAEFDVHHY